MGKLRVATNSYQNIVLLVLLVIGLLVLYRYIKNVETDTKVLNNNIIELSKKIQILSKNIQDESKICMREQVKNTETNKQSESILETVDEDNESIQSEDITNMLQKVMGGGVQEFDEIDVIINNIQQDYVTRTNDAPTSKIEIIEDEIDQQENEENEEIKSIDEKPSMDDDIIIAKPSEKDELQKKTNEELKNILKEKGLQTKGNKTELVDRILSNA